MFFVANTDHIDSMESGGDLRRKLAGVDVLFLIAGMGGGYGTRAAPEIARIARELNILTIAWVTKPFTFEGARRAILARQGIEELQRWTDACIVIPTQTFSA